MNAGGDLRREDRQAVFDGSGKGAVSRDGEEGDLAKGEVKTFTNQLVCLNPLGKCSWFLS